ADNLSTKPSLFTCSILLKNLFNLAKGCLRLRTGWSPLTHHASKIATPVSAAEGHTVFCASIQTIGLAALPSSPPELKFPPPIGQRHQRQSKHSFREG